MLTEVPCVIVNVMRGGPSTGLPTSPSQSDVMQAKWGTHGDHPVIAISPWSVKESFDLTVRCFNLSEKYRTPVILLLDETGFPTGKAELVQMDEERLLRKVEKNRDDIITFDEIELKDAEIGIFAYGSTARSAMSAIKQARAQGIKVGMLRGITIWPFPDEKILELSKKVKVIIVPEINMGM